MRCDFHLHSNLSDGADSPFELVNKVKQSGVTLFALTDHDCMKGVAAAKSRAKELGLTCVSGWEISAYTDTKVHVLGYRCQGGKAYEAFLKERYEGSYVRAEEMLEKANKYLGLRLTMSEVEAFHSDKTTPMHTMCVVQAFAKATNRDMGTLYCQLFARGMPACSGKCRPTPYDAVRVIQADGGVAVLAHPGRIAKGEKEVFALADSLVDEGLGGIECYYPTHTVIQTERFIKYAQDRGLFVSGGSDYHREGYDRVIGNPSFEPSEKLLSALLD